MSYADEGVRGVPGRGVVASGVLGRDGRGMLGIVPAAGWGVVGQPGDRSSEPKPPSLRGSNMDDEGVAESVRDGGLRQGACADCASNSLATSGFLAS
jgi:hypothetical protein